MSLKSFVAGAGLAVALVSSSTGTAEAAATAEPPAANPLLAPWTGPFGGVPPFDEARVEHLKPALEAGMAEQLASLDRIASDPAAPTFENTIAAMERSGRTLRRVYTVYGVYSSTLNDDAVQAVEREMAPKLAEFSDRITQNQPLFERIAAVYDARGKSGLTPEQQRLTWVTYTDFVLAGAKVTDPAAKKRLSEINQRLATLYTKFGQNVLADENEGMLLIESEAD
ncbi:MAG: dipeptidyl carboxypeptidase II, partial [Steroidobacteraceae bacterium]|nr:dipeptidyl carboxypeptidase II [Steroidobacteraceae bacterium]